MSLNKSNITINSCTFWIKSFHFLKVEFYKRLLLETFFSLPIVTFPLFCCCDVPVDPSCGVYIFQSVRLHVFVMFYNSVTVIS